MFSIFSLVLTILAIAINLYGFAIGKRRQGISCGIAAIGMVILCYSTKIEMVIRKEASNRKKAKDFLISSLMILLPSFWLMTYAGK